jgi:hypothetical protein
VADHWPLRSPTSREETPICGLYRRFGYDLPFVTVTVESAEDLGAVVAAVGADAQAVVRLEAEPETLRQRIIAREPETFPSATSLSPL